MKMAHIPLECVLAMGYAAFLALVAFLMEMVSRYSYRRSLQSSTVGFTYHADRDIWRCPQDQHLFPIFSDHAKGVTVYRAPRSACNACKSKAACTDSTDGREIVRIENQSIEYGMRRFHRGLSLMLIFLAILILTVEMFRIHEEYARIAVALTLSLFLAIELFACRTLIVQNR
jgi:hypothetical protein